MSGVLFIALFCSFVMGACIGSFLNVVVWRVPRGESVCSPPSHCPKCGHRIRPWENIPIISWICLGARCSKCKLPISWKYPAGESAVGFLYAAIFYCVYSNGLPLIIVPLWWWFAGTVLSAARIDWEHRIIPNSLTYLGTAVALAAALLAPLSRPSLAAPNNLAFTSLLTKPVLAAITKALPTNTGLRLAAGLDCLAGALLALLILGAANAAAVAVLNRRKGAEPVSAAIGGGDIKFLMMIGAFLGADAVVYVLTAGCILAFLTSFLWISWQQRKSKDAPPVMSAAIPLGPFLAIPALLWVVAGNWLFLLYRTFFE